MKAQTLFSSLDLLVLLKIVCYGEQSWYQVDLANALGISQSEVSKSLARSKYSGLLDSSGKKIRRLALMELLQYAVAYIFPQQPGPIVRGIATAHSAPPLNSIIVSQEHYVWPAGKGTLRGQSIQPLYPSVIKAVDQDPQLHEMLALVDALRVGRAREKEIAIKELKRRIVDGE